MKEDLDIWKIVSITLIVAIILASGIYFLGIPQYNKHIQQKQLEARDLTLQYLLSDIQQKGYTQIIYKDQSIYLTAVEESQIKNNPQG